MYRFCFVLLLFGLFTHLYGIPQYEELSEKMWEGRELAAKGRFPEAKKIFSEICQSARNAESTAYEHWGLDEEINVLDKLMSLKPVKNPAHYKVLVIFINETKARLIDKDGTLKDGSAKMTEEEIKKTKIFFNYQKYYITAFSDGNLVADVDYKTTHFKVTNMDDIENKGVNVADILSIEPNIEYRKFLFDNYNNYDVFCYVWPKPFGKTQAEGGIGLQYSLLPYLYESPQKGYMVIPANWCASAETRNTFIHELFHTIEYNIGMFPSHGWMEHKKESIPGFKGTTEYEFYQWRFDNFVAKYKWEDINYRSRYKLNLNEDIFNNYLSLYKTYNYEMNKKAYDDYNNNKIDEGLQSYPKHPYLLYEKALSLITDKKYPEAAKIAESLYNPDPVTSYYSILFIKTKYYIEDYDGLFELIKQGIKNDSFNFWDKVSVGYYLKDSARYLKDIDKQEKFYNLLVELNPCNNEYRRKRGYFYIYDKIDFAKAEKEFRKGLENYPDDPRCKIALGELFIRKKEYKEAEKLFDEALINTPSLKKDVALAYLYPSYDAADTKEKETLILKAIDYAPDYDQGYRDYGLVLINEKQWDRALEYLKKSADLGNEKSIKTIKYYYEIDYIPEQIKEKIDNPDKNAINAGLYEVYDNYINEFREVFDSVDDIRFTNITGDDILGGKIKALDVFISPGGNLSDYKQIIDEKGLQIIREYIYNGGNYIGICAGANFAINENYLNLIDAVPFNTINWYRGTGDVSIKLTDNGKKVFGNIPEEFRIRYANGTMLEPFDKPTMESYEVLARFTSGLAENGAPDIMKGREAIIFSRYGKGKILLFIPHPEYTTGKGVLIRQAVYYLMKEHPEE